MCAQNAGTWKLGQFSGAFVPILIKGERQYLHWGGFLSRIVAKRMPYARPVRVHAQGYTLSHEPFGWEMIPRGTALLGYAVPFDGQYRWVVFCAVEEGRPVVVDRGNEPKSRVREGVQH